MPPNIRIHLLLSLSKTYIIYIITVCIFIQILNYTYTYMYFSCMGLKPYHTEGRTDIENVWESGAQEKFGQKKPASDMMMEIDA
jgi:hypothetical protein